MIAFQSRILRRADSLSFALRSIGRGVWQRLLVATKDRNPVEVYLRVRMLLAALPGVLARLVARSLGTTAAMAWHNARAGISRLPRRLLLRAVRAPIFAPARKLAEEFSWQDLLNPFRQDEPDTPDLLSLLLPPPSEERTQAIVFSSDWAQRLASGSRLGTPEAMANVVAAGMVLGQNQEQIGRLLLPVVNGQVVSARRVARTESLRVAGAVQMDAHEALGDLVVGYRVNASLDDRTRPEHAARNGTIYWKSPGPGQKGISEMPHPPMEADGTMAWNCRCFLTPVLHD